jgi:hypothetical protein
VRLLNASGVLHTVAGTGQGGFGRDGGLARSQPLECPESVAATSDDGFLIADSGQVRRVTPEGTISTVAGTGHIGHDGTAAPQLPLSSTKPAM